MQSNFMGRLADYKNHFLELIELSIPLIIGNLGQILIGATDVFVAARHNINTLASVGIANAIIFSIMIIGLGLMSSISIVLSNYRGSRKRTKVFFQTSLIFSILLACLFCAICMSSMLLIDRLGFEASLVPTIKQYIYICSYSFIGVYVFQGLKEFLQAHEIVKFPNLIMVLAVFIHIILDFVLVFGLGPIPSLGAKGLALATFTTRTFMGLTMLIYCIRLVNFSAKFDTTYVKQLLKIGSPIGLTMFLEFLAFNIITIMVGKTAGILSATHNIVQIITSTTFMIPLAISNAIAIKVGFYNGAKNFDEIKMYSKVGVGISSIYMFICAVILLAFPAQLIEIFSKNPEVLKIGVPIMIVAAIFQVADGFQTSASGVLKGLKMTKTVSVCVTCGYWLIGLPLGFLLAYKYHLLLMGFWIGLAVSLTMISILMATMILLKFKKLKLEYQKN